MKKCLFISLICVLLTGCKKEQIEEEGLNIVGSWHLTELHQVTTRSVTIGDEVVDVYINFALDNTFQLYQMIGVGKYRTFSGSWILSGDKLSGTYDDKTVWSSDYSVELNSSSTELILTAGGEQYTYKRENIPESIAYGIK